MNQFIHLHLATSMPTSRGYPAPHLSRQDATVHSTMEKPGATPQGEYAEGHHACVH